MAVMSATTIIYKIIVVVNYELVLITSVPVIIFISVMRMIAKQKHP